MAATKLISVLLPQLEQKIEAHLELAIHRFQNLDATVLDKQPYASGWSITQCLWHLNSYGWFYIPQIKKGLTTQQRKTSYTSGWLGKYFTNMMMPELGSKKMKAFKDHIPPQNLDAYAVVAEFIEQQETLLQCVRKAYQANLDTRLPISINKYVTLKLGDVLQFVIAHDERHLQQALRNAELFRR
jgi:uncharacterized damage-inducible protein DinB